MLKRWPAVRSNIEVISFAGYGRPYEMCAGDVEKWFENLYALRLQPQFGPFSSHAWRHHQRCKQCARIMRSGPSLTRC